MVRWLGVEMKGAAEPEQSSGRSKRGFTLVWNKGVWPKGVQLSVGCHGGEVATCRVGTCIHRDR